MLTGDYRFDRIQTSDWKTAIWFIPCQMLKKVQFVCNHSNGNVNKTNAFEFKLTEVDFELITV